MNIGLYDADFINHGLKMPYSYNLMKLAAYHKEKHDVVRLMTDLSRADLYSKVYYNQDYNDDFNKEIMKHDNIEIMGYKMSGGNIYNFPPDIAPYKCDASIYPSGEKYTNNTQRINANRLALSGNVLLKTDTKPIVPLNKGLIIHDYNICTLPDWKEKLWEYAHNNPRDNFVQPIITKMPQCPTSIDDIKFLTQFNYPKRGLTAGFHIDIKLSDEEFEEYINLPPSGIYTYTHFAINDKPTYTKRELVELEIEILRRNFFCKRHHKNFLLYNKGICENPNLDSFFDVFITWNNTLFRLPIKSRQSFYDYVGDVHKRAVNPNKYLVKELFNQVIDLKTYAKIDIAKLILEGGEWPL